MAKRKDPPGVASMNPDNWVSGGLMSDFWGEAVKARFVIWDYEGKGNRTLAVAVTIKPDEEDEFVQYYSSGDPNAFKPSMDGKTESEEGIYVIPQGEREALNSNTNWAHFTIAALDSGFPKGDLGAGCDWVEGVYGSWNRVPQRKRSGIVIEAGEDGRPRGNEILVITEIGEKPAGVGVSAATGAGRAQRHAGTDDNSGGDLDARIVEALLTALATDAHAEGIPKKKIGGVVIKAFKGAEKGKAVARVSSLEFLEGLEGATFDVESATLYLG